MTTELEALFNAGGGFGHAALGLDANFDLFGGSANFTSINDGSGLSESTRTVSPKDLFNDSALSAPPSTAFTNLTSPDLNSPLGLDSYETSPLFGEHELNSAATDAWFPLFGDGTDVSNTSFTTQPLERTVSTASNAKSSASSTNNSPLALDSQIRRKSSVASPSMAAHAGVKSRRRKQPLLPITVDPSDKVAMKRARNTMAARESRQRKLDAMSELQERVSQLEAENENLRADSAKWKAIAITNNPTLSQS